MALVKCPNCGKEVSTLATECPQCGSKLDYVEKPKCPDCGHELEDDMDKCPNCGRPIERVIEDPVQKEWADEDNPNESRESIIKRFNLLSNSVYIFILSIILGCIDTYYDFGYLTSLRDYLETNSGYSKMMMEENSAVVDITSCFSTCASAIAIGMAGMVLLNTLWRMRNVYLMFALFACAALDGITSQIEGFGIDINLFFVEILIWLAVGIIFWKNSEYYLAQKFGQYQVGISIAGLFLIVMSLGGEMEYIIRFGGFLDFLDVLSICFIGFISWHTSRSFNKQIKEA